MIPSDRLKTSGIFLLLSGAIFYKNPYIKTNYIIILLYDML